MVREHKATRPKRAPARNTKRTNPRPTKSAGSIWDTPHVKKLVSQPVGSPADLTPEEMRAILREHLENPPPYDEAAADKKIRHFRKIRSESGALLIRPNAND
jgi:hypothetical protein